MDTTRDYLTAGGQIWLIPGGLQTAGDHLAGGNGLTAGGLQTAGGNPR